MFPLHWGAAILVFHCYGLADRDFFSFARRGVPIQFSSGWFLVVVCFFPNKGIAFLVFFFFFYLELVREKLTKKFSPIFHEHPGVLFWVFFCF